MRFVDLGYRQSLALVDFVWKLALERGQLVFEFAPEFMEQFQGEVPGLIRTEQERTIGYSTQLCAPTPEVRR